MRLSRLVPVLRFAFVFVALPCGTPSLWGQDTLPKSPAPTQHAWTVDEMADDLKDLNQGRSFERGKAAFVSALCSVCHRVGGEVSGGDFGPNLDARDEKMKRVDLLREILEPSKVVQPKYQTVIVTTIDGMNLVGMITEKSDETTTIRTRPVGSQISITIPASRIETVTPLEISMMPDGLVNGLSKETLLDLLAYVEAKGKPDSPLFAP